MCKRSRWSLGLLGTVLVGYLLFSAQVPVTPPAEIHCKHFLYGYPWGTPPTNDLVIRDCYALSSNDETKLADWVAYYLDKATVTGDVNTSRNWAQDPWLEESETLTVAELGAIIKAHANHDRGHEAPLGSFKGTPYWWQTNFLSNITPQGRDLNQGPWEHLESAERRLADLGWVLYVTAGPYYEGEGGWETVPPDQKRFRMPAGYWKVIGVVNPQRPQEMAVFAFAFPQSTGRQERFQDHLTSVDEVERVAGLNLLPLLLEPQQGALEAAVDPASAAQYFP